MSKYIIDIEEINECNKRLSSAKEKIDNSTKVGETFFKGLSDAWEGAAADAFAANFLTLNTRIKNSCTIIDSLKTKNEEVKNDFIQTDNATKHIELFKGILKTPKFF